MYILASMAYAEIRCVIRSESLPLRTDRIHELLPFEPTQIEEIETTCDPYDVVDNCERRGSARPFATISSRN